MPKVLFMCLAQLCSSRLHCYNFITDCRTPKELSTCLALLTERIQYSMYRYQTHNQLKITALQSTLQLEQSMQHLN